MENHTPQAKHAKLIAKLPTPGWSLITGAPAFPIEDHTLEQLIRMTHERHKKGETPGLIRHMEDALELDLIQIQELWAHLGLPM
ncbi:MAG: hypothetical protein WCD70_12700 [Alphaproteobacteria bacterium]